jgi:hypothetical protein
MYLEKSLNMSDEQLSSSMSPNRNSVYTQDIDDALLHNTRVMPLKQDLVRAQNEGGIDAMRGEHRNRRPSSYFMLASEVSVLDPTAVNPVASGFNPSTAHPSRFPTFRGPVNPPPPTPGPFNPPKGPLATLPRERINTRQGGLIYPPSPEFSAPKGPAFNPPRGPRAMLGSNYPGPPIVPSNPAPTRNFVFGFQRPQVTMHYPSQHNSSAADKIMRWNDGVLQVTSPLNFPSKNCLPLMQHQPILQPNLPLNLQMMPRVASAPMLENQPKYSILCRHPSPGSEQSGTLSLAEFEKAPEAKRVDVEMLSVTLQNIGLEGHDETDLEAVGDGLIKSSTRIALTGRGKTRRRAVGTRRTSATPSDGSDDDDEDSDSEYSDSSGSNTGFLDYEEEDYEDEESGEKSRIQDRAES